MKVTVLGCGRWGSFLAWYHSRCNEVMVWGREGSRGLAELAENHANRYVTLPESVRYTTNLEKAVQFSDWIVISISAQQLRSLAAALNSYSLAGKTVILCMKGLECETGKRLTQVFREEVTQPVNLAVWVGPGHVEDFTAGIPNCMVVDSDNPQTVEHIVDTFSSELIRLYKGADLIGTEIGAAAKNVIGIAAGMLDGIGVSSLKGALMARGAREIARLMRAMGGNELSAYGLCHLGDYEATLFSQHSHNRLFGENYIKGEDYNALAEGVPTTKALVLLGKEKGVDLPICETVYRVIYDKQDAKEALKALFARSVKNEFAL